MRRGILAGAPIALALLGAPILAQEPEAKPPPAPAEAEPEEDGGKRPDPPQTPEMTRGELQRQLDLARAALEDLLAKMERQEFPSEKQIDDFKRLRKEVADLEARLAATEVPAPPPADESWNARWIRFEKALEDVTRYDLKDGMFRFRLGVNAQLDSTLAFGSSTLTDRIGDLSNGLDIRRARIFASGRFFRRWDFSFQHDFGADAGVKDAWIEGVKFARFLRWRLGQFKEPFSLERHTGAYDLGFLEWSTPVATLAPGRGLGVMLRHAELDSRMQWAVAAVTSGQEGADNAGTSNITGTARITGLPVLKQEGRYLVHLGMGYSIRSPRSGNVRYQTRPEARFVTPFLDTGDLPVNDNTLLGLEFATVQGSWWAQSEWIRSSLDAGDLGDPRFSGAYIEGGWFLTGESRTYQQKDGIFGRVLPFRPYKLGGNPFKKDSNGGAFEFTGRISTTDLTDAAVRAGKIDNIGVGVNWYLTPATRFMANYIYSRVNNGDGGHANIFLIRYQFNP
jgi:phosphate-selective porin OprO/OprP